MMPSTERAARITMLLALLNTPNSLIDGEGITFMEVHAVKRKARSELQQLLRNEFLDV